MKRSIWLLLTLGLVLSGCFRPIIPISTGPKYPIDVFYDNQRPDRPYDELRAMEIREELLLTGRQKTRDGRMLARGNDMLRKDLLLARLTLDAQKLGATALVNVRYQYYTSATVNGYVMEGLAVRYRQEVE